MVYLLGTRLQLLKGKVIHMWMQRNRWVSSHTSFLTLFIMDEVADNAEDLSVRRLECDVHMREAPNEVIRCMPFPFFFE